jgi:hypothetical protein
MKLQYMILIIKFLWNGNEMCIFLLRFLNPPITTILLPSAAAWKPYLIPQRADEVIVLHDPPLSVLLRIAT